MPARWSHLLSLDQQYAFYAGYHRQPVNQIIHIICIPLIVISSLVFLSFLKLPITLFQDAAQLLICLYAVYYIVLDFKVGVATIPLLVFYYYMAKVILNTFESTENLVLFGIALQVFGWISQLFGHFYFERRSPALTESIVQSFLVAPMFVFLEPAIVLGYFPNLGHRLNNTEPREE